MTLLRAASRHPVVSPYLSGLLNGYTFDRLIPPNWSVKSQLERPPKSSS